MVLISVSQSQILRLDLSPVTDLVASWLATGAIAPQEQSLQFQIDFPRTADDPRELSEIPEVRLWFLRLDATYPWFPFLLDWRAGELARYAAMLVPHQFHRTEGLQFNPEALELLMMQKVFVLANWLPQQNLPIVFRLKSLAQMLGYDLDEAFLAALS